MRTFIFHFKICKNLEICWQFHNFRKLQRKSWRFQIFQTFWKMSKISQNFKNVLKFGNVCKSLKIYENFTQVQTFQKKSHFKKFQKIRKRYIFTNGNPHASLASSILVWEWYILVHLNFMKYTAVYFVT